MADAKDNLSQSLGFFNVLTASEDEEADEKTKKRSRENKLLDVGNEVHMPFREWLTRLKNSRQYLDTKVNKTCNVFATK